MAEKGMFLGPVDDTDVRAFLFFAVTVYQLDSLLFFITVWL